MILTGLARLGRDAELRYTPDRTPVANFLLAYNYGRKGSDNKRPTQWVDAALFGERAEKLHTYLKKGKELNVVLEDVHVEIYQKTGGGEGVKLTGRVSIIEFASGSRDGGDRPAERPAAAQSRTSAPAPGGLGDFEDDSIPF